MFGEGGGRWKAGKEMGLQGQVLCRAGLNSSHYGQTRIQPMRLGTKGFLIDSFLCKQDKTFLEKTFKYFAKVLQSKSTQQALQNLNFDFNSL